MTKLAACAFYTSTTKAVVIGNENNRINIKINEKHIEQVENFKYWGVTIENNRNVEEETAERINTPIQMCYLLKKTLKGTLKNYTVNP